MLAIGRAVMARPELLLLDEPSMGLAPIVVQEIFDVIKDINGSGTTILLVEQNAKRPCRLPITLMSWKQGISFCRERHRK